GPSRPGGAALGPGWQGLPLVRQAGGEEAGGAAAAARRRVPKVVPGPNHPETGPTIPGVRVVVDSGLVRRACFDPVTGMSRLETQRISRASSDQLQGRAGRLAAGVCYRAWSEGARSSLAAFTAPEILDADLAPLALELASWGARDAAALRWLDPPPAAQLGSARDLLERLGALDSAAGITAHGRELTRVAAHPRLAHMLLRARVLGQLPLAAQLAALLSERDLLRAGAGPRDADVRARLEIMRGEDRAPALDRPALQRARRVARDLERQAHESGGAAGAGRADTGGDPGLLLAF